MEFSIATSCFKYELNQENFYDYQDHVRSRFGQL